MFIARGRLFLQIPAEHIKSLFNILQQQIRLLHAELLSVLLAVVRDVLGLMMADSL